MKKRLGLLLIFLITLAFSVCIFSMALSLISRQSLPSLLRNSGKLGDCGLQDSMALSLALSLRLALLSLWRLLDCLSLFPLERGFVDFLGQYFEQISRTVLLKISGNSSLLHDDFREFQSV